MMSLADLRDFVRTHNKIQLPTIGERAEFEVEEKGSSFVFWLQSHKHRNESFEWVEKSLKTYNETRSFTTTLYNETQNASYVLALIRATRNAREFRAAIDGKSMLGGAGEHVPIEQFDFLGPTEGMAVSQSRIGQGDFRKSVLAAWNTCCAVTGSSISEAIRASHIKPWAVSTNRERLDPCNGLPLLATLDALFDAGLISFKDSGELVTASSLPAVECALLGLRGSSLVKRPEVRMIEFLNYHRTQVFIDAS